MSWNGRMSDLVDTLLAVGWAELTGVLESDVLPMARVLGEPQRSRSMSRSSESCSS